MKTTDKYEDVNDTADDGFADTIARMGRMKIIRIMIRIMLMMVLQTRLPG